MEIERAKVRKILHMHKYVSKECFSKYFYQARTLTFTNRGSVSQHCPIFLCVH